MLLNKTSKKECMTEKSWRSMVIFRRVFLPKMRFGPKDRFFTLPWNLPWEGLKHIFKEKSGDSPLSGETGVELKFTPETKKPTRRTVGGESKKMVGVRGFELTFLCPLKTANFPTLSRWGCPSSRKILREIRKNSHNLKIGFVYRKNALKRIRTCDLYLRLEMNHTGWTKATRHYSSTSPR